MSANRNFEIMYRAARTLSVSEGPGRTASITISSSIPSIRGGGGV
jgi:hypothetical protein